MSENSATSVVGFDRQFAVAAVVIGLSYALIVAMLGMLLGEPAAGVAGVALTALATALFTRFEGLRFKKTATTTIEIATFGSWSTLLLAFSFLGCEVVLGAVVGIAYLLAGMTPDSTSGIGLFENLSNPSVGISLLVARTVAFFAIAFCAARVITQVRYSHILIVALLVLIFEQVSPVLVVMVLNMEVAMALLRSPIFYFFGIFWIVFLAAALVGARLGSGHSSVPKEFGQ